MIQIVKFRKQLPKLGLILAATSFLLFLAGVGSTQGQRKGSTLLSAAEEGAVFHEYRGIQLGMTAEEVRKKLGTPKDKGEEQDFFVFNDNEMAQVLYDKTHKVITISADYSTAGDTVPSAKQILGTELAAKPDGSIYKLVRYPKAGFWLSYNRTAGSSPLTTITIQKIEQE
jgi:hypothetical protein